MGFTPHPLLTVAPSSALVYALPPMPHGPSTAYVTLTHVCSFGCLPPDTTGIKSFQITHGAKWWREFVRFYLGEKRKCDLSQSCGLQSLAAEVARADESSRGAFTIEFEKVAQAMLGGPAGDGAPSTLEEAHAALATLIGAVTLARAVNDPAMAKKIAASAEQQLLPRAPGGPPARPRRRRRQS